MFGHPLELIVVLILALIFFGPEKLPEVAATAGRFVRDIRESFDAAMNHDETVLPDDFETYYYDSYAHSGEEPPVAEELPDPADAEADYSHTGEGYDERFGAEGSSPHEIRFGAAATQEPPDMDGSHDLDRSGGVGRRET